MKILHITLTILIIAILPFVVFTLVTSKTPIIAGIQSFVVLTGSMQPTISQGSIIFTKPQNSYQKGDIVSFSQKNITVTHRIIGAKKQGNQFMYATKGDANKTVDETFVAQKEILGKSIFALPYLGKLVLFLKTFTGYAALIIFPTMFFIVFELNNVRKEIMRMGEKKAMEKMHVT